MDMEGGGESRTREVRNFSNVCPTAWLSRKLKMLTNRRVVLVLVLRRRANKLEKAKYHKLYYCLILLYLYTYIVVAPLAASGKLLSWRSRSFLRPDRAI